MYWGGKMKITITLLTFIILSNLVIAQQWYWQNPLPQGNHLNDVSFVSQTIGWTVGGYGTILKTTDGGTTWTTQSSGTTKYLAGVSFIDENIGTVVNV